LGLLINDRHLTRYWIEEACTKEVHPWTLEGLAYLDEAAADLPENFGVLLFSELRSFQKKALAFMQDFDVLLSPVASFPAPVHCDGLRGDNYEGYGFSVLHNVTGWPAATVRCGTAPGGLPIGVQIAGLPFREEQVLLVAEHLEEALGGWSPPPGTGGGLS
jgi:Asp-tRNA(Asn)/Glu-tRNA(Gln) amidotransferase A subunit family amidase